MNMLTVVGKKRRELIFTVVKEWTEVKTLK